MVGFVVSSHSKYIAEGVKEIIGQLAPLVPVAAAGGTDDGRLGTDVDKIVKAIESVYSEDGVIIVFDMGSSFLNAEIAIGCMDENKSKKIRIADVPIVEGAVTAAVESNLGKSLEEIINSLKPLNLCKIK